MKKFLSIISASALIFLFGCASDVPEEIDEPDNVVTEVEEPESTADHRWVQDLWLFDKVGYFSDEGALVDVTERILLQMSESSPNEKFHLDDEVIFNVFNALKPSIVDAQGTERNDVDIIAGLMDFAGEELLAILATPDEDADAPIGLNDFLELDLSFLGGDFEPGVPMTFDFGFLQSLPGDDPKSANPLELLKHRMDAGQINFFGIPDEDSDDNSGDGSDEAQFLTFQNVMGVAVEGSTRMNVNGKENIADPMLKGFGEGARSARKGGVGGVSGFFKKFGRGAKKSNDLIDCNLGGCGEPDKKPKEKPKKCYFNCGKISGDPHMETLDGLAYDMQGVGEFTLVESADLNVQMRTEPMFSSRTVSVITGLAVEADGQTVVVRAPLAKSNESGTQLFINEEPVQLDNLGVAEAHGDLLVTASKGEVVIETSQGSLITALLGSWELSVFVDTGSELVEGASGIKGMLGDGDGDLENDLFTRDGEKFDSDLPHADSEKFYDKYVNSWRITQADSLFVYDEGQSTESLTDLTFPGNHISIADVPGKDRRAAKLICEHAGVTLQPYLDNCIFDYWVSQDMRFVRIAQLMDLHSGIISGDYELYDGETSSDDSSDTSDWPEGFGPEDGQSIEDYVSTQWKYSPHSRYWGGDEFSHFCPPGGNVDGPVWGGGKNGYTSDSAVCVAAVHTGVITPEKGGLLHVKMIEGVDTYPAEPESNGVTPQTWDSDWSAGFTVELR